MCWSRQGLPALAAVPFLLPYLQTHPSAWPFMEPVKKSEAPDYYEIIRFPIGGWLCPDPGGMVEGGLDPCIVWSMLEQHRWGNGSPRTVQKRGGRVGTLGWGLAPWLGAEGAWGT